MHPVTTRRAPALRTSARARTVSTDSRRASSMNAQVLTTTRSASSAESAPSRAVSLQRALELVAVDLVLRAAQCLDPVPAAHHRKSTGNLPLPEQGRGVDDLVGVALLGQEPLPVGGEQLVVGVARHDAVEVGRPPVGLGPQDPAEPLGFLLAAAERAGDLDGDRRVGQIDREVGDLRDDQQLLLARSGTRRRAAPARRSASCR